MRKPLEGCLLVSDIDGTLIRKDFSIPQKNKDAIKKFTDLGGHFTLASGRSFSATMIFAKQVDTSCPIITYNGAAIFDMVSQEIIWQLHLPESAKQVLAETIKRFPEVGAEIHSEGKLFLVQDSKEAQIHLSDESLSFVKAKLEDVPEMQWNKILYAAKPEALNELKEFTSNLSLEGAYHIMTSPIYFEMIPENANKGTALTELAKSMDIEMKNVYAIGDFYNDIELLKAAGVSAIAKNAPEEMRQYADFISDSNEEGAVAGFIEYIIQSRN